MRINEVMIIEDRGTMRTRFRRSAKTTAMLDGHPENPKKILTMMKQSLDRATGYRFKVTPKYIEDEEFWGMLIYDGGEYKVEIAIEINWYSGQQYLASIDKPIIRSTITAARNGEQTLFHQRRELTTEYINTMWDESTDDIHIAADPSKKWSFFDGAKS